ncbi:MAG: DUF2807 domain-containing protein [Mediterranea sp.]|nr:DUF2807 domain-containing protein [Mediterranea sp.]
MATTSVVAQESFSRISLSGFTVNLTQSNLYSIETDPNIEVERKVENGTLYIGVIDQTGTVPKSTISISVNELSYLELHNSNLIMESPVIVDTLDIELNSSFGTLKVNAKSLSITVGAGARFSVEGNARQLICNVGAASNLSASKLTANQASLSVVGHSYLTVNAQEVISLECDKTSRVTNVSK